MGKGSRHSRTATGPPWEGASFTLTGQLTGQEPDMAPVRKTDRGHAAGPASADGPA
jgi:hypothetical protein